jgi:hypothetical protein
MGLEAECAARIGERPARGKVLLETDAIIFRGDVRATIPLGSVKKAGAKGGVLTIEHAGGEARFELGDAAERWAERIRSPKGLLAKLGVRPAMSAAVVGHGAGRLGEALAADLREAGAGAPAAKKTPGARTKAPRKAAPAQVIVAEDLREALERAPAAKVAFERMPPSHRREHVSFIDEAKRPDTRARRIAKTIERLAQGGDAR